MSGRSLRIALARGGNVAVAWLGFPDTSRHTMAAAYNWSPTAAPSAELRRLARAQADRAGVGLDLDDRDAAVHQVRKRCKKLRALLRLVRPVAGHLYAVENPTIRDLARPLSEVRDNAVALKTFGALVDEAGELLTAENAAAVRAGLASPDIDAADREATMDHARAELAALLGRIETDWMLPDDVRGVDAVLEGFGRSYARGRDMFGAALEHPTTEALHDWRKRVKDHGYHCRLLRSVWPPVLAVWVEVLGELGDLLGDDHDLAVLRARLQADPDRFGGEVVVATTTALVDRRRATLQQTSVSLGQRVYADRPKALRRQIAQWWDAAVADATPSSRCRS